MENYLRLDDDIQAIHGELSRDPAVAQLIHDYPGMRLLRQDPWDCLVAYLCSANNNIHQISRICERLADTFGGELYLGPEKQKTFPDPYKLACAGLDELKSLHLGLKRHENIFENYSRSRKGDTGFGRTARCAFAGSKVTPSQMSWSGRQNCQLRSLVLSG